MLSRYSGQTDVVFGIVVAGRPPELVGVESMVGLFISTVPVRVHVQEDARVGAWLRQLQKQQVKQRSYEYSSLVQVQGWSAVPRDQELFESLFIFENYPVQAIVTEQPAGSSHRLVVEAAQAVEQTNYPLTIMVGPGTRLHFGVSYDRRRFEQTTIERLLGHMQVVLEQLVGSPHRRLAEISLLTEVEREQLLVEWNAGVSLTPTDVCVHQLFESQVEQRPEAIAVVFADEELTVSRN